MRTGVLQCQKPVANTDAQLLQEHHDLLEQDASCMDVLRHFFSGRSLDRQVGSTTAVRLSRALQLTLASWLCTVQHHAIAI